MSEGVVKFHKLTMALSMLCVFFCLQNLEGARRRPVVSGQKADSGVSADGEEKQEAALKRLTCSRGACSLCVRVSAAVTVLVAAGVYIWQNPAGVYQWCRDTVVCRCPRVDECVCEVVDTICQDLK